MTVSRLMKILELMDGNADGKFEYRIDGEFFERSVIGARRDGMDVVLMPLEFKDKIEEDIQ